MTKRKMLPEERDSYFIEKILEKCPWNFKKVGNVWYKRARNRSGAWMEVKWTK